MHISALALICHPYRQVHATCGTAIMNPRSNDADDSEFWEGISAVKFLGVPELQQQITVTGYPIGGDSLSITQGIVSRVTMNSYTPGGAQLMNVQVRRVAFKSKRLGSISLCKGQSYA